MERGWPRPASGFATRRQQEGLERRQFKSVAIKVAEGRVNLGFVAAVERFHDFTSRSATVTVHLPWPGGPTTAML